MNNFNNNTNKGISNPLEDSEKQPNEKSQTSSRSLSNKTIKSSLRYINNIYIKSKRYHEKYKSNINDNDDNIDSKKFIESNNIFIDKDTILKEQDKISNKDQNNVLNVLDTMDKNLFDISNINQDNSYRQPRHQNQQEYQQKHQQVEEEGGAKEERQKQHQQKQQHQNKKQQKVTEGQEDENIRYSKDKDINFKNNPVNNFNNNTNKGISNPLEDDKAKDQSNPLEDDKAKDQSNPLEDSEKQPNEEAKILYPYIIKSFKTDIKKSNLNENENSSVYLQSRSNGNNQYRTHNNTRKIQ